MSTRPRLRCALPGKTISLTSFITLSSWHWPNRAPESGVLPLKRIKKDEESNKSEISDNATEKDVKKNNFTGLSAIIPGQAEPGTLHEHTPQPQRSSGASLRTGSSTAVPSGTCKPPGYPAFAGHCRGKADRAQLDNGCIGPAHPAGCHPAQPGISSHGEWAKSTRLCRSAGRRCIGH